MSTAPQPAKTLALVLYVLYAASFFTAVTAIIAIIVNHVKRDDVAGTFVASHFRWQIRTFWFGLLWAVIGSALLIIGIGWVILLGDALWVVYRIVRGLLRLNEDQPMYA